MKELVDMGPSAEEEAARTMDGPSSKSTNTDTLGLLAG